MSFNLRQHEHVLLSHGSTEEAERHELATSPLVTFDAYRRAASVFPQLAVFGSILEQNANGFDSTPSDCRLYMNTNTPLSAVVCGVQGSGKSHTVSVLLENLMLKDRLVGDLKQPMAGVVFHVDEASREAGSPCEAAYLAASGSRGGAVPVKVLVSPSNLKRMKEVYQHLPVKVLPMQLCSDDITASRFLTLMVANSNKRPLFIEKLLSMMRKEGDRFNYKAFRKRVMKEDWDALQTKSLQQRLDIIDVYLAGAQGSLKQYFKTGQLVICDLTDPMVDATTSASLFDIVLGMFDETPVWGGGKVVLLDEAHKYLTPEAKLTDQVLSLVRQQRHVGMRILISTQEPTVVDPRVLDLVSFIVIHRFTSPSWATHLNKHIHLESTHSTEEPRITWFDTASRLRTGEALIFAPSALALRSGADPVTSNPSSDTASASDDSGENGKGAAEEGTKDVDGPVSLLVRASSSVGPKQVNIGKQVAQRVASQLVGPLGSGCLKIRTRLRLNKDGGASVLAVRVDEATRDLWT